MKLEGETRRKHHEVMYTPLEASLLVAQSDSLFPMMSVIPLGIASEVKGADMPYRKQIPKQYVR